MSFSCSECGAEINNSEAKFCSECGTDLKDIISGDTKKSKINIFELGEKLEEAVELVFQSQGFDTKRRQRLKGKSGTINEIDVVAKKGKQTVAVECKNLSTPVGQNLMRDFCFKLGELNIKKGYFASNTDFTSGARKIAQHFNVTMWTKENLQEKYWSISIGRSLTKEKIDVKNALPLNIGYEGAVLLDLENSEKVKIVDSYLTFHPYYIIDYGFKAKWNDPTRNIHKFNDEGTVYIDAISGNILNIQKVSKKLSNIISSSNDKNVITEVIEELRNNKNASTYTVLPDPFQVNVKQPEIQNRFTKKLALDWIIDKNTHKILYKPKSSDSLLDTRSVTFTPKSNQVMIKKITFLNVPKWSVTFDSFGIEYSRELFAFSGVVIEDGIEYCPRHFTLGSLKFFSKQNIAVCEICGQALCNEHVSECPVCGKWVCQECGISCEVCGNYFCSDHITHECAICENLVCDSCYSTCTICNAVIGNHHVIECESCGSIVCPNCSESKGLIRKKHYCINCS